MNKQGYKKTKIGWIPNDWATDKFSTLLLKKNSLGYGVLQPGNDIVDGVPMLRTIDLNHIGLKANAKLLRIPKELDEQYKKTRLEGGEIIISVMGTLGRTVLVPEEWKGWNVNRALAVIRTNDKINKEFLIQTFRSPQFERRVIEEALGSAQKRINLSDLRDYLIILPPLPEQQKIAQILSTWDKAIEQSQNLIEQLKKRKKWLMQQLLTGKTRLKGFSGEWKKYQISDLATNYNLINKDNKVQEVLSCTKYDGLVRSLEYFGRKVYGDDLSKYKVVPSGYFAYATNHIEEGSIGYQDILDFGLVSPMYTVFKTNDKVDDAFFFKLLKTDKLIYYYQSNMTGSIARRGGLRWNVFETIIVKIPSIEEQQAIAKVLTIADKEIKAQENFLAQLQEQKKGLMQKLLTGEVRVKTNI